ncbi:hypothetical protein [Bacillus cereus group sp. N21]|uniref:hypothetical protein n=1 Tax=Bacillus cereus group sp. N21 TaxID=2794591 RepID=UPI001F5B2C6C|nr:hypothetical protein [Bacillus cereus group sp. N21]
MSRIKYSKAEKLAILTLYKDGYPKVKAINVTTGVLPTRSEKRKFSYLDDEMTIHKYIVVSIGLFNGRQYKVLEIERESRSLSMLILSSTISVE